MTDGPGYQTQSDSRRTDNKLTERPRPSNKRVSPADEELEPEQPVEEDEFQSSRTELTAVISQLRDSKLSRSRAITKISSIIDNNSSVADPEKKKAIDLYLSELSSIQLGKSA